MFFQCFLIMLNKHVKRFFCWSWRAIASRVYYFLRL